LICTVGLSGLLLSGCADTAGRDGEIYVVQPQDTLYSIAWRHNLDYRDLARWNHLAPDFRIVLGQALVLDGSARAITSSAPGQPDLHAHSHASPLSTGAPADNGVPPSKRTPPREVTPSNIRSVLIWGWPTERTSAALPVAGGGILIAGRFGQDVRAASAGKVVYIGNGLRGYGNLIIIKHGENLLSAYAHNRDALVHEGQEVGLGEVIAHMGEGAPQKPVLYFEIRLNGKPVDPVPFLPSAK
jgi:lipoprotein NlpD